MWGQMYSRQVALVHAATIYLKVTADATVTASTACSDGDHDSDAEVNILATPPPLILTLRVTVSEHLYVQSLHWR